VPLAADSERRAERDASKSGTTAQFPKLSASHDGSQVA
jgi:hypothetical protein